MSTLWGHSPGNLRQIGRGRGYFLRECGGVCCPQTTPRWLCLPSLQEPGTTARGGAFFDTKQEGAPACRDQNTTADSPTSVCSLPCCKPIRRPSSCWSISPRGCRPKPTTPKARRI